jgi:hypothetical protein
VETTLQWTPQLAASGVEILVILLFFAGSALVSWLQKKKQQETEWSEVEKPPRPGAPPKPASPPAPKKPKRINWEEELRRLLEGDEPEEPARPPRPAAPQPPPLVREAKPPPQPPARETRPVPSAIPKVVGLPRKYKAHCENCGVHIEFTSNMLGETIVCPQCYQQTTLHPFGETKVEEARHRTELSTFKDSSSAFERASHLAETVAAKMHEAISHPITVPKVTAPRPRSAEIEHVVKLLRNPQTARQAVIASVILAPPKGLEN